MYTNVLTESFMIYATKIPLCLKYPAIIKSDNFDRKMIYENRKCIN